MRNLVQSSNDGKLRVRRSTRWLSNIRGAIIHTKRIASFFFAVLLAAALGVIFGWRLLDYGDFSVIQPEDNVSYESVSVNGVTLHVATAGPETGEPVFLLHGFPDAHFGWHNQMRVLADSGFRVIVPDQRGFNLSSKPKGIENYQLKILASDIVALMDHYRYNEVNLAGHDFGGIVSWYLADAHPDRLKRMAIFNAPHPLAMRQFQEENDEQRKKSWYIYFYQYPIIPELVMQSRNWRGLSRALGDSFSEDEIKEYKRAWSQPGAMTATINWYRAWFNEAPEDTPSSIIDVPTMVVWGRDDPHLMWQIAKPSADMTTSGEVIYIEGATHWVLQDAPEETSDLIVEFFRQVSGE